MCQVLKISRSGYDDWLKNPLSQRKIKDIQLKQKIIKIYQKSRKTYGSPRIHQKLLQEGCLIGKKRIARLMQEIGLNAVARIKYGVTTDFAHAKLEAKNHRLVYNRLTKELIISALRMTLKQRKLSSDLLCIR